MSSLLKFIKTESSINFVKTAKKKFKEPYKLAKNVEHQILHLNLIAKFNLPI
jgi:hypothetical protein